MPARQLTARGEAVRDSLSPFLSLSLTECARRCDGKEGTSKCPETVLAAIKCGRPNDVS